MKRKISLIIILVMSAFMLCACGTTSNHNKEVKTEDNQALAVDIFAKYDISEEIITNLDIVPDKKTAKKVAKDILISVYGEKAIERVIPLNVKFDSEFDAWVVTGTLEPNMLGGVPTIIIQKKDGKVLAVNHTK